MTRPRPPRGDGNQDDPTEMGRTQDLGHRTQNLGDPTVRSKAISDQQADSLAWSQEDRQAGGPQDYGPGYQQHGQYEQPQYQQYAQPQYQQAPYQQPQYQQPQYGQQPAPAAGGTKLPLG